MLGFVSSVEMIRIGKSLVASYAVVGFISTKGPTIHSKDVDEI